jgi:hypothetical protein
MKKFFFVLVIPALLLAFTHLNAEERFGVEVYKGAKHEDAATDYLQNKMNMKAFCYRTGDNVANVIEFYKGKEGLYLISEDDTGAFFRRCERAEFSKLFNKMVPKNCDLDITIQSPWMNMKTEKVNSDTLISFVER